jgi:hypothetical protein
MNTVHDQVLSNIQLEVVHPRSSDSVRPKYSSAPVFVKFCVPTWTEYSIALIPQIPRSTYSTKIC